MKELSILLIDDSEADRYLLKRDINKVGCNAHFFEVENGIEALAFLEQQGELGGSGVADSMPELAFLDINMPLMGGFKFLQEYENLKAGKPSSFDVIVMSSSANDEDKTEALAYPFVKGYFVKGEFEQSYLISCIDSV